MTMRTQAAKPDDTDNGITSEDSMQAFERIEREEAELAEALVNEEVDDFYNAAGFTPSDTDEDERERPLSFETLNAKELTGVFEWKEDLVNITDLMSAPALERVREHLDIDGVFTEIWRTEFESAFETYLAVKAAWPDTKKAFNLQREHRVLLEDCASTFARLSKGEQASLSGHMRELRKAAGINTKEWEALVDEAAEPANGDTEATLAKVSEVLQVHTFTAKSVLAAYQDPYGRPTVMVNEFNEEDDTLTDFPTHTVATETMGCLAAASDLNLYKRSGVLGHLRSADEDGGMRFEKLTDKSVTGVISRGVGLARWRKVGRGLASELIIKPIATPPREIGNDLLTNQDYENVKPLNGIVTHPYLLDGQLHHAPGYHEETRLFYPETMGCELVYPESIDAAIALLRKALVDFKFEGEADFQNAIGLMLTPIIRHGLSDLPPMFNITAAKEGSGKSYLAKCLLSPTAGGEPTVTNLPPLPDEMRKQLFSMLMQAHAYIIADNVNSKKPLDSGVLASYVTERFQEARLLYQNTVQRVENQCTMIYTGSNVETTAEIVDRCVQIKLQAPTKRVADRDFQFDPLHELLIPKRGEYLGALCYLVQQWIDAGMPKNENARHRQREWAHAVGGILEVAGIADAFLMNDPAMRIASDPESVDWGHALQTIAETLGYDRVQSDYGFQIADVFNICSYPDEQFSGTGKNRKNTTPKSLNILGEWIAKKGAWASGDEHKRRTALGTLFREKIGGTHGGWSIQVQRGRRKGKAIFQLVIVGDVPPEPKRKAKPAKNTADEHPVDDIKF